MNVFTGTVLPILVAIFGLGFLMVVHEAGHFLGLNHTNGVSTAVMYPFVPTGSTKRVLTPTDENDVCAVYPGGTGGQGTTCTTSSQCSGGRAPA